MSFEVPGRPDFQDPANADYWNIFAGAYAQQLQDLQLQFDRMLSEKHAPLLIPRITIDPASTEFVIVAAGFNNLNLPNTTSTTSTSAVQAFSYTGRGVLQKLVMAEIASGGAAAQASSLDITVDGNVVFSSAVATTTQSSMKVIVGDLLLKESTSLIHVADDSIGLPYNKSIVVNYRTNVAGTIHLGWKVAKKL